MARVTVHKDGQKDSRIFVKDKSNNDVEYDPTLIIEVDDQYEVIVKNIPGSSGTYNNQKVTWFNNFLVKKTGSHETQEEKKVPTYKVFLQPPPDGPNGKRGICALYGGRTQGVTLENPDPPMDGKVMFTLGVGDPPVGMFP